MKKSMKYLVATVIVTALFFSGIYLNYDFSLFKKDNSGIRAVVYEKDFNAINQMFHRDDNWYWMISNYGREHGYDLEFTIKNKSSSPYEARNDLIMKVMEIDGKIAGFTAYHPLSTYKWQFLFLLVDQDFRGQGLAKKLLKFAVDDMMNRGAIKIDLATRLENIKAQDLYKKFGFKPVGRTEEHQFMAYTKKS